jgi:hypothetical protein
MYLFIYGMFKASVSRPISGAQEYSVTATQICTALGFVVVISVIIRQAFSLSHFFIRSHFQADHRLSDKAVETYLQMANCTRHSCFLSWQYETSDAESICLVVSPLSVLQCLCMCPGRWVTDCMTVFNFRCRQGFLF